MVPNGWEHKSLEEVSKIIDCKHRTPKYVESGIPLVSPGSIKWGPIDLISPTKRVSDEEYESLMDHCTVDVDDLVLSRNQSVGVASFIDTNKPFVLGQDTVLVKPINSDSKFLFYNLQSTETQRTIFKLAGGSTFSRINLGEIRKLKTIYPPLPEQQKIAKILSTWDKAISTTEALIDNSKQQKKALMQQLLTGKKRLLDDSGKAFEGEWEEVKLGEISNVSSSKRIMKSDYVDKGVPFYRSKEIILKSKGSRLLETIFISTDKFVELRDKFGAPVAGDILITAVGSLGVPYLVSEGEEFYFKDGNLLWLRGINKKVSTFFLLHHMRSEHFQNLINSITGGSSQKALTIIKLAEIKISIPNIDEQQIIASVLTNADKEIELLEQQLADLKQEKKALMQQLLTGKHRVKVDEIEAALA